MLKIIKVYPGQSTSSAKTEAVPKTTESVQEVPPRIYPGRRVHYLRDLQASVDAVTDPELMFEIEAK